MNTSCISDHNYFDTHEFLSTALHITTVLATPVYFFGMYIILTKTPERMKGVKWYLFNLHGWIILFDYTLSILTIPFLLIPAFAGYPLGILKYTGISTMGQVMIVFYVFACMIIAIVIIFENRFYKICTFRFKYKWEKFRKAWIAAHFAIVLCAITPFFFLAPEQGPALQRTFSSLPCLPHYIYNAPVFVFAENYVYHLTVIIICFVICGVEVFSILGCIAYNMLQQVKAKTMSAKTFQMQKSFFVALLIQLAIPLSLIILPVVTWLVCILGYFYNQMLTNFAIIMYTLHGSVSTIAMLIAHRPYREAILIMVRKKCSKHRIESMENSRRVYIQRHVISDVHS